jgi:peptide/nickel transport system permease protein
VSTASLAEAPSRSSREGRAGSDLSVAEGAGRRARRRRASLSLLHWLVIAILAAIVLSAVFANLVAPFDPEHNDLLNRLTPPAWADGGSSTHLLGTDQLGRDILSRLIFGARVSLQIAVIGTLLGATLGAISGMVAGFRRGLVDDALMLVVDAYMALPFLIVALSVIAVLGTSFLVIVFLAMISGFASYTRVTRGLSLQIAQQQYVLAARTIGVSPARLLLRHALPNILAPLIVLTTMEMSSIVLLEASLSFLGLGIQPPTPAWGLMVNEGRDYLSSAWWVGVLPGVAIMLLATSISLFGDWLRDALDPTTRN